MIDSSEDLSDEEKSYYQWVSKNLSFINQNKQSVNVMKKLYMEGFAAGWQTKKESQAKEWLQK
jgi:hypothetical protein